MGKKISKKRSFGQKQSPVKKSGPSVDTPQGTKTLSTKTTYDYSHYSYILVDIKRIGFITGIIALAYLGLFAGSYFLNWF